MSCPKTEVRVAVVTGAAQGLGKEIALKLASLGHCLVLGDLASKQEALSSVQKECSNIYNTLTDHSNLGAHHMACDVTHEQQVDALVKAAVDTFGCLDVMIANAGIVKVAPLLQATASDFDAAYNVNAKGAFFCYRAAARAMIPNGGGRIIGACSAAGKFGYPYFGTYCASKAALRSLTQTAAREWAGHGITVNAYAPGAVDTDMWRNDVGSGDLGKLIDSKNLEATPTRKKTTTDQLAGLVAFLISPAADNITGQIISIDGGFSMN